MKKPPQPRPRDPNQKGVIQQAIDNGIITKEGAFPTMIWVSKGSGDMPLAFLIIAIIILILII